MDLQEIRALLEPEPALVERALSCKTRFEGRIFSAETLDVSLPDGSVGYREIVRHHGGAAVCAIRDGRICLVRQWRIALGRMTLEVPAGKLEAGEDPREAAARELAEETGLVAGRLDLIAHTFGSPGFTDESTYVYRARDLSQGPARPDEGEFVQTVWLPVEAVLEAVRQGLVVDGKTILATLDAALRG